MQIQSTEPMKLNVNKLQAGFNALAKGYNLLRSN